MSVSEKAFICGVSGLVLSDAERRFLEDERPFGLILFARNLSDPEQILGLVAAFCDAVGSADAPVFIDQEGGRVQRLKPPLAPIYPPGRRYGEIFEADPEKGRRAAFLGARLIAGDLADLGITADCLPVLDVPVAGAHDVIGDRAYGTNPETVAALGRAAAEGLMSEGLLPVIKHIPGHGRGTADSHLSLPTVEASREDLAAHDFPPFRALADLPAAMTAHVVYTALDPDNAATVSKRIIAEIIRGELGFSGLLMSDDVSMKALGGTMTERCEALFAAGCDLALHCNGDLDEMRAVAAASPVLDGAAKARADRALALVGRRVAGDPAAERAEFMELMADGMA
ncbi:beta-N-acetylhexosaminidase [Rhodobium gokarnense]|uniref:beta-N-acetylhexosaminidase n=1 Tax=Rhodobium gokarnense TaxID=364296 RepID=A0ABT3HFN1_9HYPH|nr:beta-N-acetylhexosaminidase [Rhodobium gokarnense]MCW2309203.1 beta-N-acetylhexosaminidase [Rhodobium gokarnense]